MKLPYQMRCLHTQAGSLVLNIWNYSQCLVLFFLLFGIITGAATTVTAS